MQKHRVVQNLPLNIHVDALAARQKLYLQQAGQSWYAHSNLETHRHHKKRARGEALLTATSVASARSRASCTKPYDPRLMSLTLMYFSLLSKGSDSVRSAPCI